MSRSDLTTVDPDIFGGTPVFKGTHVPVKTLFDHLADNYSLVEFLECFSSVTRKLARRMSGCSKAGLAFPEWIWR